MADPKRAARLALLAGCAAAALIAPMAQAQDQTLIDSYGVGLVDPDQPIIIIADEMRYDSRGEVATAAGNAEAVYGERVLQADALQYDAANGTLKAQGGVVLRNDDGSYLFADDVALDGELSEGSIEAPRALINGGAKLAAASGQRLDDRYTVLEKAVYSPCEVCEENPEPLWQVRAARVIHDEEARQVIYEDATFDILGQPVGYLPYFSHPDPSVKRRTGFLAPEFGADNTIGYTLKTPYFVALAPDRDLTITPYVMTQDGLILEGEYRALTETGEYRIAGAITNNDRTGTKEWRGALEGEGRFELPDPFRWGFDLDMATDDTFLRRYQYSDEDRVTSRLFGIGETDRLYTELNGYYFQSFRANEPSDTVPWALPEFRLRYRALEDDTYGIGVLTANALQLYRERGRDVTRVAGGAEWDRRFITDTGVVITPFAAARADAYVVNDDATFGDDPIGRLNALAGVEARMPFIAYNDLGEHIIEPIVQAIVAPYSGDSAEIPNEDSLDIEFDETTVFATDSRFPGLDRWESGPRLNAGLRYSFEAENGFGVEAVYGRVFRLEENTAFSTTSGLRDRSSDHVTSIRLTLPPYFDVTHRMRLDDEDLTIRRNEVYFSADVHPVKVDAGYVFTQRDPLAGFANDREEIALAASIRAKDHWTLYGLGRHDLERGRSVEAEGGLRYEDECIYIDLSVSRRYNDDRDAQDGTNFGLRVRLKSLGA